LFLEATGYMFKCFATEPDVNLMLTLVGSMKTVRVGWLTLFADDRHRLQCIANAEDLARECFDEVGCSLNP
jgi:hypothetical protein